MITLGVLLNFIVNIKIIFIKFFSEKLITAAKTKEMKIKAMGKL